MPNRYPGVLLEPTPSGVREHRVTSGAEAHRRAQRIECENARFDAPPTRFRFRHPDGKEVSLDDIPAFEPASI